MSNSKVTSYDLKLVEENLKELRVKNKNLIKKYERDIKQGYDKHGILFTSQAKYYVACIEELKGEIKTVTQIRNEVKKALKCQNKSEK